MTRNSMKWTLALLGAGVVTAGAADTSQAAVITAYTATGSVDAQGELNDDDATITSITTAAGGTVTGPFVGPTSGDVNDPPGVDFVGDAETAPFPTRTQLLLGNVPTRAWADSGTNGGDYLFGQTISDNSAGSDTSFEVFLLELAGGDSFTITAITGGTAESPTLGPSAVTFSTAATMGPRVDLMGVNGTSGNFAGSLGGLALDISDLGVTSLTGIRFTTNGGDPAAILAVVPEPASLALLGLGGLCLLSRQRRGG